MSIWGKYRVPESHSTLLGVNRQLPKGRVDDVDDLAVREIDEVDAEYVDKLTRAAEGRDLRPQRVGVSIVGRNSRYGRTLAIF